VLGAGAGDSAACDVVAGAAMRSPHHADLVRVLAGPAFWPAAFSRLCAPTPPFAASRDEAWRYIINVANAAVNSPDDGVEEALLQLLAAATATAAASAPLAAVALGHLGELHATHEWVRARAHDDARAAAAAGRRARLLCAALDVATAVFAGCAATPAHGGGVSDTLECVLRLLPTQRWRLGRPFAARPWPPGVEERVVAAVAAFAAAARARPHLAYGRQTLAKAADAARGWAPDAARAMLDACFLAGRDAEAACAAVVLRAGPRVLLHDDVFGRGRAAVAERLGLGDDVVCDRAQFLDDDDQPGALETWGAPAWHARGQWGRAVTVYTARLARRVAAERVEAERAALLARLRAAAARGAFALDRCGRGACEPARVHVFESVHAALLALDGATHQQTAPTRLVAVPTTGAATA
jgi:hypothetical protein